MPRRFRAFTLVELLVVVGIIAVLIAILLPSLQKARQAAQSVACKSLLRQYVMASLMYQNDNDGWCVDIIKFLDYDAGLLRYMGQEYQMSSMVARCPGDADTEAMGRLGSIGDSTDPDYQIRNANGELYSVQVSIGANDNSTSCSKFAPSYTPRYIKFNKLRSSVSGWDPSKTMTWADYQNNRGGIGQRMSAIVGPGSYSTPGDNTKIGSMVFRHNGVMNAAFADGHVGEIRTGKKLINNGHDLAPGESWGIWPGDGTTGYGTLAAYKVFYPFAPGIDPHQAGGNYNVRGTFEMMDIN